jgi:hypothetical protein
MMDRGDKEIDELPEYSHVQVLWEGEGERVKGTMGRVKDSYRWSVDAEIIPYEYYEERDQRTIFRALLTDLLPSHTYTFAISFTKDASASHISHFAFKTLPSAPSPLNLLVTSNRLTLQDPVSLTLTHNSTLIQHTPSDTPHDLTVVVGDIAYDFGFYEGYFLYDLFLKTYT